MSKVNVKYNRIEEINIIKTKSAFGNVAGCIPLFKIGGTISKVKVVINNATDTKIITRETLNSSLKKKGKLLFALFCFCTFFIFKCTLN